MCIRDSYYIVPDGKAGVDAFAVIRDAMKDQDRVALARIVLTNREHVMMIEPLGNRPEPCQLALEGDGARVDACRSTASHRPIHQKTETMTFNYFCFAG